MAEEQKEPQVTKEPEQGTTVPAVTKELQRVTTKNPKTVEAGKRLAVHNHKKREEKRKDQAKLEKTASRVNQYYGIGAVIALGVIGGLGCYYIYRTKKGEQPSSKPQQNNPKPHPQAQPQTNKFEMN